MKRCDHQFRKTKNLRLYCDSFYSMPVQYYREYQCIVCGAIDLRRDKLYRRRDETQS